MMRRPHVRRRSWIVVLSALHVAIAAQTGGAGTAGGSTRVRAVEILDRYAATQDQLRSCHMVVESRRRGFSSGLMAGKPWRYTTVTREDVAVDGFRACVRSWTSGRINPTSFYKEDAPYYVSELWDGTTHFRYVCGQVSGRESRSAYIKRISDAQERKKVTERVLMNNSAVKMLMGYFYGQPERIDRVLCRAATLSVRTRMEEVGNVNCHVINASAGPTQYTLWLDPAHGYHIVRFRMVIDEPAKEGLQQVRVELRDTVFEKSGQTWVCAGGRLQDRFGYSSGDYAYDTYDLKVEDFALNPDDKHNRRFIPDDIADGTHVKILDGELIKGRGHIWTKGIIRDEAGNVIATFSLNTP